MKYVNPVFIYSLESEDKPIYIGKTNDLKGRYRSHVLQKRRLKPYMKWNKLHPPSYVGHKLYTKLPDEFIIKIIDIVENSEWEFWEKHYISLYRSWGFNLLNVHKGGMGDFRPKPKQ